MTPTPEKKIWKAWRKAVRRRVKKNPALKRQRRRASNLTIMKDQGWSLLRWAVPVAVATCVVSGMPLIPIVNVLLLWTLLITVTRLHQVATLFYNPNELWLFYGWPVSDDTVFNHHRSLLLKSSVWLGLDWLAFGGALSWRLESPWLILGAGVLAIAQWLVSLNVAVWLVRWKPYLPYGWLLMPLGALMFFVIRFIETGGAVAHYRNLLWTGLNVGTPAGWVVNLWGTPAQGVNVVGSLGLTAICAIAGWLLVQGERSLHAAFSLERMFGYSSDEPSTADQDLATNEEKSTEDEPAADSPASHPPIDIALLRKHITGILEAPSGKALSARGPAERAVSWFLTERQKRLVDYMQPGGQTWKRRWLISGALILLLIATRGMLGNLALIPAIAALAFALPVTGGRWHGFDVMPVFQAQVGLHAYIPAGFGEISGLLLKINALHCLLALPLVLAVVWFGFAPLGVSPHVALDYVARGLALLFAFQPIWILGKFSANTNDSSSGKLFLLGMVLWVLIALIGGVSLCVTALMVERISVAWVCLTALALLTHGTLGLYGWAWNHGRFDLMPKMK